jgi:hypothetical protein
MNTFPRPAAVGEAAQGLGMAIAGEQCLTKLLSTQTLKMLATSIRSL